MPSAFRHQLTSRKLSIATVSLAGTLQEKLEAAANIGFDGVEIFENDLLTFDGTPEDVRRMCDDLGLTIDIFQPFRDFEAMPEPFRRRNLDRAERKFDVMQALGTDLVLVCTTTHPQALDDNERAVADFREMAERAARRGLRIGVEGLAWSRYNNRWRQVWDIVQKVDHQNCGLIVDSFHTLSLGDDPSGIADLPGDRLFYVQLADAPKLSMDVLSWSRHFRNFPGQGQLPVDDFVRAVLASGYQGPLSLEIFNDDFRATQARLTARDGLRSLVFVQANIGALELPAPPVFDGVEFLEFAVDATTRDSLGSTLASMGFRRVGTHRSKDVTLYRQGRINLVLNAEPDSSAAEHFLLHGPSVCAMALRVDSSARAIARARALLCQEWQERVGDGERRIPALRAPDGTLIYLIENADGRRSIFENDFILADSGAESMLTETDHVAQALPTGRMDSYVLFYKSIFGFSAQGTFELPDPYGLIRSRAMLSADNTIRLPLNISESRETATGRFVSAFAGAGVHHIAFATPDIYATVAEMRRRGTRFLPIPANYYDDIAARFGLEDDEIARLQALDLLYDRDEGGTFIQAFTETFEDRFFFEIVQRDGYDGFGAANASMRMAVQAQRRDAAKLGARLVL